MRSQKPHDVLRLAAIENEERFQFHQAHSPPRFAASMTHSRQWRPCLTLAEHLKAFVGTQLGELLLARPTTQKETKLRGSPRKTLHKQEFFVSILVLTIRLYDIPDHFGVGLGLQARCPISAAEHK